MELKSILRNLCYDVRVARHCGIDNQYNTGAVDVSDIYVIEHAYNDIQNIFYDVASNFNTIPDDPFDKNTPIGALNALIKYIYEKNSKATIVLIGHYECQLSTGRNCKSVIEKVAEYWSLPFIVVGLSNLLNATKDNATTAAAATLAPIRFNIK
jgi:CTP synthase (UTP-ammonia lyase)